MPAGCGDFLVSDSLFQRIRIVWFGAALQALSLWGAGFPGLRDPASRERCTPGFNIADLQSFDKLRTFGPSTGWGLSARAPAGGCARVV